MLYIKLEFHRVSFKFYKEIKKYRQLKELILHYDTVCVVIFSIRLQYLIFIYFTLRVFEFCWK